MSSVQFLKNKKKINPKFIRLIKYLFTRWTSAFLMIVGKREGGKTDLGLFIAELVHDLGIINNFATNIKIYESPFEILRITNLEDLKHWCKTVYGRKLYILDEAGKSVKRRKPMSSINIKLLDELQVMRKYKLSLIFITPHEQYLDSAILETGLLDGYFRKTPKNQKIALYEDLEDKFSLTITNIPPTSIKFDTWDTAPFTERESKQPKFKEKELQILWEWSHGKSYKDFGLHPQSMNRILRRFVRRVLERGIHYSHTLEREDIMDEIYSQNSS